jgi:hypothetical protein
MVQNKILETAVSREGFNITWSYAASPSLICNPVGNTKANAQVRNKTEAYGKAGVWHA